MNDPGTEASIREMAEVLFLTPEQRMATLKSPYPWFGGKRTVASLVWERFGKVRNYVEPFFGSGAVLLGRPQPFVGSETVNDINAWLTNFWRAIQAHPDAVAVAADWPVSELDLHARGDWLFYRKDVDDWIEQLRGDPDFYDVKSAGWWVWALCAWIGDWGRDSHGARKDEEGNAIAVAHSIPHLGDAGRGINRQLPHLGNAGRGEAIREYFAQLSARFRNVRVCCGDWSRVCGPSVTFKHGLTAVFLDPPYTVDDRADVYGEHESKTIAHDVREWVIANGDNPLIRVALCGYDGEHDMPESWAKVHWKAHGGYGSQSKRGNDNAAREVIWFSPHCLGVSSPKQEALW